MFPVKATYCSIDYRVIFKIVLKVHQRKVEKSDETTSVRIKRFLEAKLVNCSAAWPLYRCHVLRRDWRLCFISIIVRFIDSLIMDMLNFRINKISSIWQKFRESNTTKNSVKIEFMYSANLLSLDENFVKTSYSIPNLIYYVDFTTFWKKISPKKYFVRSTFYLVILVVKTLFWRKFCQKE